MTKHNMRFFGVSPFFKQQNNNLSHITSQPKYIVTNFAPPPPPPPHTHTNILNENQLLTRLSYLEKF